MDLRISVFSIRDALTSLLDHSRTILIISSAEIILADLRSNFPEQLSGDAGARGAQECFPNIQGLGCKEGTWQIFIKKI